MGPAGVSRTAYPAAAMSVRAASPRQIARRHQLLNRFGHGMAGGECWIVNNLPYAGELEYGHSQQAPQGLRARTAMSDAIIRAAIEARLKAWADAQAPKIPVAFENSGFKPTIGQQYLSGDLLPAQTLNPSQGGEHKHFHGIYQVSIRVPEGRGTGDASALSAAIAVLFKCPTTIPATGLNVHINRTPSAAKGGSDGAGFYMVPVSIWYDADSFT
eukprot:gene33546-41396_t